MHRIKEFNLMADAIYQMHRALVQIKKDVKSAGKCEDRQKEVMQKYADTVKNILEKVGKCITEWLLAIKPDSLS